MIALDCALRVVSCLFLFSKLEFLPSEYRLIWLCLIKFVPQVTHDVIVCVLLRPQCKRYVVVYQDLCESNESILQCRMDFKALLALVFADNQEQDVAQADLCA